MIYVSSMTPDELDELESGLDPAARFIVGYLRQDNAQLRSSFPDSLSRSSTSTDSYLDGVRKRSQQSTKRYGSASIRQN